MTQKKKPFDYETRLLQYFERRHRGQSHKSFFKLYLLLVLFEKQHFNINKDVRLNQYYTSHCWGTRNSDQFNIFND